MFKKTFIHQVLEQILLGGKTKDYTALIGKSLGLETEVYETLGLVLNSEPWLVLVSVLFSLRINQ